MNAPLSGADDLAIVAVRRDANVECVEPIFCQQRVGIGMASDLLLPVVRHKAAYLLFIKVRPVHVSECRDAYQTFFLQTP